MEEAKTMGANDDNTNRRSLRPPLGMPLSNIDEWVDCKNKASSVLSDRSVHVFWDLNGREIMERR